MQPIARHFHVYTAGAISKRWKGVVDMLVWSGHAPVRIPAYAPSFAAKGSTGGARAHTPFWRPRETTRGGGRGKGTAPTRVSHKGTARQALDVPSHQRGKPPKPIHQKGWVLLGPTSCHAQIRMAGGRKQNLCQRGRGEGAVMCGEQINPQAFVPIKTHQGDGRF